MWQSARWVSALRIRTRFVSPRVFAVWRAPGLWSQRGVASARRAGRPNLGFSPQQNFKVYATPVAYQIVPMTICTS